MAQISVVVPVYNCKNYLNQCIESVLKQTFKDFELILVDDGSTDGSGAICDQYAAKDKRVCVIHKENGGGAGEARNRGLESASSPFISFLDSDDWMAPEMLERLYKAQQADDSDVVICGYKNIVSTHDTSFNFDTVYDAVTLRGRKEVLDYFVMYYPEGRLGYPWNKLYRRALLMEHQIRFPKMRRLEDGIFNVNVFEYVECCTVLPDVIYQYRASQQVEQRKLPKDFYSLIETFVLQFYSKLKAWGYPQNAEKAMVFYFLNDFVGCLENLYFNPDIQDKAERKKMLDEMQKKELVQYMLKKERNVPRYSKIILDLFSKKHYTCMEMIIRMKIFSKTKMYSVFQKIKKVAN